MRVRRAEATAGTVRATDREGLGRRSGSGGGGGRSLPWRRGPGPHRDRRVVARGQRQGTESRAPQGLAGPLDHLSLINRRVGALGGPSRGPSPAASVPREGGHGARVVRSLGPPPALPESPSQNVPRWRRGGRFLGIPWAGQAVRARAGAQPWGSHPRKQCGRSSRNQTNPHVLRSPPSGCFSEGKENPAPRRHDDLWSPQQPQEPSHRLAPCPLGGWGQEPSHGVAPCPPGGQGRWRTHAERCLATGHSETLPFCHNTDAPPEHSAKRNRCEKDKTHMISHICGV